MCIIWTVVYLNVEHVSLCFENKTSLEINVWQCGFYSFLVHYCHDYVQ